MIAIVVERPGGPEMLQLREVPRPQPKPGWVLIRVKAFGLNRAELFTRQGLSPGVAFPRVLGIECAGVVEAAPETEFNAGQTVVAMMGGMGRQFDGSYAEYTSVAAPHVLPLHTDLDWTVLGAIPEMFQTAWGSLTEGLEAEAGQSLLIRGATSSVGLMAILLAKERGLQVAATTRNPEKAAVLEANGADAVIIDTGTIAPTVRDHFPNGVDRVLELVGTVTLLDSLQAVAPRGICCMSGILGNRWSLEHFAPMEAIPTSVKLTSYSGTAQNVTPELLQSFVNGVKTGRHRINIDRIFSLEQLPEAHRYMEENRAKGKLVVRIE